MVRKIYYCLFFILLVNFSYSQIDVNDNLHMQAQSKCDTSLSAFGDPEKLPVFDKNFPKNSSDKLMEFVMNNLNYPETAKNDKIEGQVFVEFWIDTNGNTSEHRIVNGVRKDLDDEVLRLAKLIKYDEPAMNNGKPIGICYWFTVRFCLSEKGKLSRKLKCK